MRAVLAVFALALAACAAPAEHAGPTQNTAESQCAAQGGQLERVGRAQTLQCVIPYADAGKACRGPAACESGRCLGPADADPDSNIVGECAPNNMRFGCYSVISGGRVQSAICVD